MSNTKRRNADRVWQALHELCGRGEGPRVFFRVSEIAIAARMSTPTVRRYLRIMVDEGYAETYMTGIRQGSMFAIRYANWER